jgi:hypothetical protein
MSDTYIDLEIKLGAEPTDRYVELNGKKVGNVVQAAVRVGIGPEGEEGDDTFLDVRLLPDPRRKYEVRGEFVPVIDEVPQDPVHLELVIGPNMTLSSCKIGGENYPMSGAMVWGDAHGMLEVTLYKTEYVEEREEWVDTILAGYMVPGGVTDQRSG